ncbi:phosphorylated adapter RNA export protein [Schistocerca cancellata]|uniref:phosphorylated adapter RNA export protein n=1 Tax=Schistocerca cancellata TaxID=274614 RepID=UPI0021188F79|nr:phosphorylated adapter RNA export protein [Schistocerca cancellata]
MDNTDGSELEDGEIVEYTPLERPVSYSAAPSVHVDDANSDDGAGDGSDSESEDSDSPCFSAKRHKMQTERCTSVDTRLKPEIKKKKYDIWCAELQESALTDDLVNIDVANKIIDRSRNVESYDYRLAFRHHSDTTVDTVEDSAVLTGHLEPTYGNKRRFDERGSLKQRLGRRESGSNNDNEHCAPRHLLALNCSPDDSEEELAKDIADKLWEQKEELILKVVQVLGKQKAIDLFEKTRKVEEVGGLMIMNGQRRRTPGGSYLFLLKMDNGVPQEKKQKILMDNGKDSWKKLKKIRKKRKFIKKTLSSDKLSDVDLPTLLTRAELAAAKANDDDDDDDDEREEGEAEATDKEEGEAEATDKEDTTNPPPPPSPATDGRDNSSDGEDRTAQISFENRGCESNRCTVTYDDDDFLDVSCNPMDLF